MFSFNSQSKPIDLKRLRDVTLEGRTEIRGLARMPEIQPNKYLKLDVNGVITGVDSSGGGLPEGDVDITGDLLVEGETLLQSDTANTLSVQSTLGQEIFGVGVSPSGVRISPILQINTLNSNSDNTALILENGSNGGSSSVEQQMKSRNFIFRSKFDGTSHIEDKRKIIKDNEGSLGAGKYNEILRLRNENPDLESSVALVFEPVNQTEDDSEADIRRGKIIFNGHSNLIFADIKNIYFKHTGTMNFTRNAEGVNYLPFELKNESPTAGSYTSIRFTAHDGGGTLGNGDISYKDDEFLFSKSISSNFIGGGILSAIYDIQGPHASLIGEVIGSVHECLKLRNIDTDSAAGVSIKFQVGNGTASPEELHLIATSEGFSFSNKISSSGNVEGVNAYFKSTTIEDQLSGDILPILSLVNNSQDMFSAVSLTMTAANAEGDGLASGNLIYSAYPGFTFDKPVQAPSFIASSLVSPNTVFDQVNFTDGNLSLRCGQASPTRKSAIFELQATSTIQKMVCWFSDGVNGTVTERFNIHYNSINPKENNTCSVGTSDNRFNEIFCTNGVINTSDWRLKKDVTPSILGLDFISALNPVSYRWIQNESSRYHHGLIAQDVKTVMDNQNISTNDFAGFIHSQGTDTEGNDYDVMGLRYTEFIAPLIRAVKELKARVIELENRV